MRLMSVSESETESRSEHTHLAIVNMDGLPIEVVRYIAYSAGVLDAGDVVNWACTNSSLYEMLLGDAFGRDMHLSLSSPFLCIAKKRWRALKLSVLSLLSQPGQGEDVGIVLRKVLRIMSSISPSNRVWRARDDDDDDGDDDDGDGDGNESPDPMDPIDDQHRVGDGEVDGGVEGGVEGGVDGGWEGGDGRRDGGAFLDSFRRLIAHPLADVNGWDAELFRNAVRVGDRGMVSALLSHPEFDVLEGLRARGYFAVWESAARHPRLLPLLLDTLSTTPESPSVVAALRLDTGLVVAASEGDWEECEALIGRGANPSANFGLASSLLSHSSSQ